MINLIGIIMGKNDKKVVSLANARDKDKQTEKIEENAEVAYCSFCGRPNFQVLKLIKGPNVNICSECVMICVQYLVLQDRVPSSEAQKILDTFWQGLKK